jgi:hypothetical protein
LTTSMARASPSLLVDAIPVSLHTVLLAGRAPLR